MLQTTSNVGLDEFLSALERRVAEAEDLDAEWQLRLIQVALGRHEEARHFSSTLTAGISQRMLTAFIDVAIRVHGLLRRSGPLDHDVLVRVEDLRTTFAERAGPAIGTIALCRRVATFGVFEEMNSSELVAGSPIQTIVYSEIRNLKSEQTPDQRYRVLLRTRLELLTVDGQSVWQREEPEITDLCRTRRTDFFVAQRIELPNTLRSGEYVMKVFVEDRLSGLVTETGHPFSIQSPSVIAKGG